ncbi:MAG: hypothetical protein EXQ84_01470 [Rhodospirillaceae bacterium]|nr:hypothetical protein [Rhodospirillaceae bacterium]
MNSIKTLCGSGASVKPWARTTVSALALVLGGATAMVTGPSVNAADAPAWAQEPACQSLQMVGAGGPAPKGSDLMVLRYVGSANFELAYRDSVILFDAQYEREAFARPIGVTADQIKKVTALYIGHGHGDHMSEGPQIAKQANAPLYGAALTTEVAVKMGLPEKQAMTVKNGDVQKYLGFTVESILSQHNSRTPEFTKVAGAAWAELQKATGIGRSPEARAAGNSGVIKGTNDPHVLDQGTYAFLITFDNGFKFMMLDSSGPVTEGQRAVMKRIGKVDVASVAYQGYFVPKRQIEGTLPLVELFKPDIFLPNHHDETAGSFPDMGTEPLFMAVRDKMPATQSIAPLYRTPVCINIRTKEVFIGEPHTWPANKRQS